MNATTGFGVSPCLNRMAAGAVDTQPPKLGSGEVAIGAGLGLKAKTAPNVDATGTNTSGVGR